MRQHIAITGMALTLLSACAGIDESNLKLYPSKVYLSSENLIYNDLYDFGDKEWKDTLHINKSGYYDTEANVSMKYDAKLLDTYMETHTPEYTLKVLPENAAKFASTTISMNPSQTLASNVLDFDMNVVREVLKKETDPEVRYVYPVKLDLPEGTAKLNEEKSYVLVGVNLLQPVAQFAAKGTTLSQKVDLFRNPDPEAVKIPLKVTVPFENKKFDLNFTYVTGKQELVNEYNTQYGTDYTLLPEDVYTKPTLSMKAGENSASAEMEVDVKKLPKLIGGGGFILPIEITGTGNETVSMEKDAVCYLTVTELAKYTGNWKVKIEQGESNVGGTTPGSTLDTYLFNYKDAKKYRSSSLPASFFSAIETDPTLKNIKDELIVCSGWSGTMFENASPCVWISNEPYDNTGKKKVEIIYDMIINQANRSSNNKSWYDPKTNQLHLDYEGNTWGAYRYCRTYSGQTISDSY